MRASYDVEALDARESRGIQCGIALRVGSIGAWVTIAMSVSSGMAITVCD